MMTVCAYASKVTAKRGAEPTGDHSQMEMSTKAGNCLISQVTIWFPKGDMAITVFGRNEEL